MTVKFETIVNFRDVGGYQTKDGRTIKHRKLLRSGELCNLTANDQHILLTHYNVENIIDLRTEKEILEKPDTPLTNTSYFHLDMFKQENGAPSLESLMNSAKDQSADEHMKLVYEAIVKSPVAQTGYRNFFQILLETTKGASIWHCFAGKDRTGIGAALVLWILNVEREIIMADYLQTNADRAEANARILAELAQSGMSKAELDYTETSLNVKEDYLLHAYNIINNEYGSLANYVRDVLKISNEEINLFQTKYLD